MSVFSLCVNARVSGWQLFWWNGTTTYPKTDLAHRSDQKNAPYPSKGPARPDFRSVPFSLADFPGGGWHDLRILGVMPRLMVSSCFCISGYALSSRCCASCFYECASSLCCCCGWLEQEQFWSVTIFEIGRICLWIGACLQIQSFLRVVITARINNLITQLKIVTASFR